MGSSLDSDLHGRDLPPTTMQVDIEKSSPLRRGGLVQPEILSSPRPPHADPPLQAGTKDAQSTEVHSFLNFSHSCINLIILPPAGQAVCVAQT